MIVGRAGKVFSLKTPWKIWWSDRADTDKAMVPGAGRTLATLDATVDVFS